MPSARVETVLAALLGHSERAVKVLAVEITAALQERNPVDTGWSRANWIPSIGPGPSSPFGSRDGGAGGASDAALAQLVTAYRLEMGEVHITNHVGYIRHIALPPGSSPQAPDGFVEQAIEAGLARARAVIGSRR